MRLGVLLLLRSWADPNYSPTHRGRSERDRGVCVKAVTCSRCVFCARLRSDFMESRPIWAQGRGVDPECNNCGAKKDAKQQQLMRLQALDCGCGHWIALAEHSTPWNWVPFLTWKITRRTPLDSHDSTPPRCVQWNMHTRARLFDFFNFKLVC